MSKRMLFFICILLSQTFIFFITIFFYTNWSAKQFRRRMGVDHEFRWIWLIKYSFSLVFFEIYHVTFLSKKIIINDKFHSPAELNNAKLEKILVLKKLLPRIDSVLLPSYIAIGSLVNIIVSLKTCQRFSMFLALIPRTATVSDQKDRQNSIFKIGDKTSMLCKAMTPYMVHKIKRMVTWILLKSFFYDLQIFQSPTFNFLYSSLSTKLHSDA